jgi:hypothetical protein
MPATKIGSHRKAHHPDKAVPIAVTSAESGDVLSMVA